MDICENVKNFKKLRDKFIIFYWYLRPNKYSLNEFTDRRGEDDYEHKKPK